MEGSGVKVHTLRYPRLLESWLPSMHSLTWALNLWLQWVVSDRSGLEKAVFTKQLSARLSVNFGALLHPSTRVTANSNITMSYFCMTFYPV